MRHIFTALAIVIGILNLNAKELKIGFESDTIIIVDENVSYKFNHDLQSVYLNISTADTNTIMSMLHMGVSVFFDVKGKKKQNVYVKYPLEPSRPNSKRGGEEVLGEEIADKRSIQIKNIIENELPQEAIYSYFEVDEEFHILLNTVGISLGYTYDEATGLLDYSLTIPKNKISDNPKADFNKLMIGIKTNGPEEKSQAERPNISMGGRGGGQRGGGGRQGGGQRGGGRQGGSGQRGGGQGGSPNDAQNDKPKIETLDFWFDAPM
ncbi:hypothetical protein [Aurantibacter sp.]|uniref:hypothetical protein n=1 Tax=Aurantibacter sp. TaxID=2807103 RepID=UPI003265FC77